MRAAGCPGAACNDRPIGLKRDIPVWKSSILDFCWSSSPSKAWWHSGKTKSLVASSKFPRSRHRHHSYYHQPDRLCMSLTPVGCNTNWNFKVCSGNSLKNLTSFSFYHSSISPLAPFWKASEPRPALKTRCSLGPRIRLGSIYKTRMRVAPRR